jgi:putative hydrolase of the HAD superfamily
MLQALLIDLDGVIRTWRSQDDPEAERGFGLPAGAIRRAAFAPERLLPAITGQVSDSLWRAQIVTALARHFPGADVAGAMRWWSATPGEVDRNVLALVAACRRCACVVLVTNATSRLPDDLRHLGLDTAFDQVINSAVVGAAKPNRAIFAAALAAAGVDAPSALFVDDTPGHVAAARRLGIRGYWYTNAARLREILQGYGLLPSGGPSQERFVNRPYSLLE